MAGLRMSKRDSQIMELLVSDYKIGEIGLILKMRPKAASVATSRALVRVATKIEAA